MVLADITTNLETLVDEGTNLQANGKFKEAEKLFQSVLRIKPRNVKALQMMGVICFNRGNYSDASMYLLEATRVNPIEPNVKYHLAMTYSQMGRKDEAIDQCRLAVKIKPDYKDAHRLLWNLERKPSSKYFSEHGQDEYIFENFFKRKKDGFFLDIGAFDGLEGSNTMFFEKHLGWDGICVEPSPTQFKKLKSSRQCECLNLCVSDFEGEADYLHVTKGPGIASGLINSYDPFRMDSLIQSKNNKHEVIPTKVKKISNLLKEYELQKIDYCSIDVEGAEYNILRDIRFEDTSIKVLSVENNSENINIGSYLKSQGYEYQITLGADEIYKKIA